MEDKIDFIKQCSVGNTFVGIRYDDLTNEYVLETMALLPIDMSDEDIEFELNQNIDDRIYRSKSLDYLLDIMAEKLVILLDDYFNDDEDTIKLVS